MKKTHVFVLLLISAIVAMASILICKTLFALTEVNTFSLVDYEFYLAETPYNSSFNEVSSADTAKAVAEEMWLADFGKDVANSKPYSVFYDPLNTAWLVRGNSDYLAHCFGIYSQFGGNPYIIINQEDGKVLAVWCLK